MPSLPTGTVTFLFTDIEGSTDLIQRLGDRRYAELLSDYRRLLRAAFVEGHGQEVNTAGDAFLVAFSRAGDALATAVAAQRVLAMHTWPQGVSLRVRIGLHTGEPRGGATGYVGIDIHRAARICDAGHGGQILLSETARALVADDLPERVRLLDLGWHRLKDLGSPQRLFQVAPTELPSNFPPLNSLEAVPNNLPVQLTSFIGREREREDVRQLLSTTRLLTLTGAGGSGKTRVALHVAADLLEEYPDGVWLVELARVSDPTFVPRAVASVLGVTEQPGRPMIEVVADALRTKSLLLILDNCEHVLSACAQVADTLLRSCPGLRILATSREALRIAGEVSWPVPSLSLPDPGSLPTPDDLLEYEAVQLFIERAVAVFPAFSVTTQNARAIAHTCQQLDGIPLALELAAARVSVLSADQIAARLDDRFRLLTGGSRTAFPRQQTLRATMDWSYGLLSDQEQTVLRRLSVFAGGWTLEAAEAVCSGGSVDASDILDVLASLVDKSLVVAETETPEARYRLLETVRQYGWDCLVESNEAADARRRHRDWYLDFTERVEPKLRGPDQVAWGGRLETEHDNLRAALAWSKTEVGGGEAWLRLAGALRGFWHMRGYLSEGREWLEGALAAGGDAAPAVRAKALSGAGLLARRQGDFGRAGTLLQDSLSIFRQLGDKWGTAFALHQLAHVVERQGDYDQAAALLEESVALFKAAASTWGVGWSLGCQGYVCYLQGDYDRATALLEESLPLLREVGNIWTVAYALNGLGGVARRQGDYRRAAALLEEGLALARHVGDTFNIPILQYALANVSFHHGDHERAAALYRDSLVLRQDIGDKAGLADCLEGLAGVACARGRYNQAARILGAADALREATGYQLSAVEQSDHDERMASTRAALGEKSFDAAWTKGRTMTLEHAIECALNGTEEPPSKGALSGGSDGI